LSRYKNILVLVAILLGQVIGLAMQVRKPNPTCGDQPSVRLIRYWVIAFISPIEKLFHGTGGGVSNLWSNYINLRHVQDQNQQLREQLNRLQLEQAGLLEDARQGQRLQAMLAFKEHYINQTVPAQVIGTSGSDRSRVLYIDKGAKDGLRQDMAVITPDGIVGKLKDVYGHTSQVLVISDQTSGAGVLLESTRLRGVLRGNDLGQPQMINMLPDERIKPGERVITSGGDQIFPRGLPVGVVDRVIPDSQNPPYVDILIKPAANLGHLEELLVITEVSDQLPKSEERDLAQSQALGAVEATKQRASDILAERLPGLSDTSAIADTPGQKAASSGTPVAPKLNPPPALHPDHFSPQEMRPASALTPGQVVVDQKYAPLPPITKPAGEAAKSTADGAKSTADGKPVVKPSTVKPATVKPATPKTNSGDDTPETTTVKPKPKPKPTPPENVPQPPDTQ
jgi:rod shape-determining protein MreC